MIITNEMQYYKMLKFTEEYNYFAYDVETTGLNVRRDIIVGIGISNGNDEGFYLPIKLYNSVKNELEDSGFDPKPLLNILKNKNLIMWNGSFDIRITKNNFGIDLKDSLHSEGMLMKHSLIEDGRFGLKDTGIEFSKEIGFDVESLANEEQLKLKENLKEKGAMPKEFYKADLNILGTYCIKDCILTFRLFKYFYNRLESENLIDFFYKEEVMPLYKEVTIPMEENGVKLNMPKLTNINNEILKDISNLKNMIIEDLLGTQECQDMILEIAKNKYPPKNRGVFAQKLVEHFDLDLPKSEKTGKYSITKSNLEKLDDNACVLYLKGVYTNIPTHIADEVSMKIYKDKNPDMINIGSRPQMKELVFSRMGLTPLNTTKTGPQFDATFIDSIQDQYEWAKNLSVYNKLVKIQTSYFQRFIDNNEDGYYYFSYKQHGTISGRYGSDAQQMPRPKEEGELPEIVLKYNNAVRELFIAKDNMCFIDNDYASLEPHVFAHVSGDEGLRDIFRKGHDFYSTIAIATEKLSGYSADKKADNYLGNLNKPLRQAAKAYSLGIPYGMSAYALGKTLDISTKEAKVLVDGYLNGFPNLKKWMQDTDKRAKTLGIAKTETGRVRHLPKVKEIYKKYGDDLNDWAKKKKIEVSLSGFEFKDLCMDWKNGLNNAKNFQIQGLSASIVNRSMISMTRRFKELNLNAYCVAQIHDQVIVECDEDIKEVVKEIVQNSMENTYKISIKLTAEPEIGYNWSDAH